MASDDEKAKDDVKDDADKSERDEAKAAEGETAEKAEAKDEEKAEAKDDKPEEKAEAKDDKPEEKAEAKAEKAEEEEEETEAKADEAEKATDEEEETESRTSGAEEEEEEVAAAAAHAHEGHAHDEHAHHGLAHITPVSLLFKVWAALMFFTFLTVGVTYVDFGGQSNLVVAMVIATIKASLVVVFFMHLRWDRRFHALTFLSGFLFVILFIGLALTDRSEYQPMIKAYQDAQASQHGGIRLGPQP